MEKFLIVGGGSKLARCFQDIYKKQAISLLRSECDITSEASIRKAFLKYDFNYVLNCAAMTDIEECEKKPLECFGMNAAGVFLLNKLSKEFKKKLIHISSNYAVDPRNAYGWSKNLGEKVIDKNFLIIRTSFYNSDTYIVKNLLGGKIAGVYRNMYFNPVSINKLAECIMANRRKRGLINVFSSRKISYLDFARLFCREFELDHKKLLDPIIFKPDKNKADRPLISFIKSDVNIDIIQDLNNYKKFIST